MTHMWSLSLGLLEQESLLDHALYLMISGSNEYALFYLTLAAFLPYCPLKPLVVVIYSLYKSPVLFSH